MINLQSVAQEIGVPKERLLHTLRACKIPFERNEVLGTDYVTGEVADQLVSIYRNASQPTQVPRPTPEHLREEYTPFERGVLRREHDARFGPAKGDLP